MAKARGGAILYCFKHKQDFIENPFEVERRAARYSMDDGAPMLCLKCVAEARRKVQTEKRRHLFRFCPRLLRVQHEIFKHWLFERMAVDSRR